MDERESSSEDLAFYFSQLGNSGNSATSVKGKCLTNVKMYVEREFFQKVKFNYKTIKYQM